VAGSPEVRPWATMLGALLYNHRGWLPTDRAPAALPRRSRLRIGRTADPGIGEHAAAPYMHAWDEIVGEGGKGTVRRLLDAADAAAAASWSHP
jgi:hypothetical protein